MIDPHRLHPLHNSHKVVVETVPVFPNSKWHPGLSLAQRDYLPHEMPDYLRQRLVKFLLGIHPIPPSYLLSIITPEEARAARPVFKQLLASGATPGDALIRMGVLCKERTWSPPSTFCARVENSGCNCIQLESGDPHAAHPIIIIDIAAGEPLSDTWSVIECSEALVVVPPEVIEEAKQAATNAENSRRAAWVASRSIRAS